MSIQWMEEAEKRRDGFIRELQELLKIKSVYDETTIGENAPFGKGIKEALEHMLEVGKKDGFMVKNIDGYAGHLEYGDGSDVLGILCHLDVVPEGDDWDTDPYGAVVKEGKIYARGAMDDKGPTMAAYFALKMIKELQLPLTKKVRMIFGGDEESQWRCMEHYFKHEEMPEIGFAPDADFPLIYAEKGIGDCSFTFKGTEKSEGLYLESFKSGRRLNMVPDLAIGRIANFEHIDIKKDFDVFIKENRLKGFISAEGELLKLELKGLSAHGAEPHKGKNAAVYLAEFLGRYSFNNKQKEFLTFLSSTFLNDVEGKKLGIHFEDDVSGKLTVNVGIVNYDGALGGEVFLNVRFPVKTDEEKMWGTCKEIAEKYDATFQVLDLNPPHYVDRDHELVQTLLQVYREQTGDMSEPIAIGGGTYARTLKTGVAFGALFPGKPELAHQKNEYAEIDDLIKSISIYAQGIWELAK